MPKIQIFSDIHQDWQALKHIIDIDSDYYVNLGDLTSGGMGFRQSGEILSAVKSKLYSIPGNNESEGQHRDWCRKYGFFNLHNQNKILNNINILGFGLSTLTPFNTPGEISEKQIQDLLSQFLKKSVDILFTHCPPAKTNISQTKTGIDSGSLSIREFIQKNQPKYCFSGHVHENEGLKDNIGKTPCFLVGKAGNIFKI